MSPTPSTATDENPATKEDGNDTTIGVKRTRDEEQANDKVEEKDQNAKKQKEDREEEEEKTTTKITVEGFMPQKKYYRSRAHCNPLSHNDAFDYPLTPSAFDWTTDHYPNHPNKDDTNAIIQPDVLDVGCGFGGLTIQLSTLLPQSTILGIEIRAKVCEYVRLRIVALRKEHASQYENCSVMRSNAMKYLPHYFRPNSISKLFFCFPDPHFKEKNHRRRIISERLLSEYIYLLKKEGGRLYCVTDVEELHLWHVEKCDNHPLLRKLSQEEMEEDVCVETMRMVTEEGKKVERAGAGKYYAVYEKVDGKENVVTAKNFFKEGEFGVVAPNNKGKE